MKDFEDDFFTSLVPLGSSNYLQVSSTPLSLTTLLFYFLGL